MKHALYGLIRSSDTAKARISELLMSIEIAEKEEKKKGQNRTEPVYAMERYQQI